ncbi:ABC transporter ATP-binding protein [Salinirubrum litoreum]|uniref:ABC transporter ATP-binding protein n=1 Tax=Salinirubrum litoreum TaxID=1126234 RepID=A0ABD5RGA0_9EURY|nr:ABC transporter ATP-binding protein [Salinirubrum litoreum]
MRLVVENLSIEYATDEGPVRAVDDVSFELPAGQRLGLVGESGCGKTTVAKSLIGLLPENGSVVEGSIRLEDGDRTVEVTEADPKTLRSIRWRDLAIVSQSAMNALDPVYTVGDQIAEAIRLHENVSKQSALGRAERLLDRVGLDSERTESYPHQLSGGMRQRVMIAMALALEPAFILADEPTTALDVITQDHILAQIDRLTDETGNSLLMITHDISVVAETCDRVGVMYAGELVEVGPLETVFTEPEHPYTQGLLNAFPSLADAESELITVAGEPPDLHSPPTGCRFYDRCPYREERCREARPALTPRESGQSARCYVTEDGLDLDENYERIMEETDRWHRL